MGFFLLMASILDFSSNMILSWMSRHTSILLLWFFVSLIVIFTLHEKFNSMQFSKRFAPHYIINKHASAFLLYIIILGYSMEHTYYTLSNNNDSSCTITKSDINSKHTHKHISWFVFLKLSVVVVAVALVIVAADVFLFLSLLWLLSLVVIGRT